MNHQTSLINGTFHEAISASDRGLAYGDGVFRTLKVVDGMPKHWPTHYQKLFHDCCAIGIVCPDAEVLMHDFSKLFSAGEGSATAKIMITRGEGERGYNPPAITSPIRIMLKSPLPTYPQERFTDGVKLYVCNTRLSHQKQLAGVKHLARLDNVLARMEWTDPAYADGIMLDDKNNVIECVSANIFARFDEVLLTPKLDCCGVAGITRGQVLNLAEQFELKPQIGTLSLERLLAADEVVICNSLFGVWQVRHIQQKQWPKLPLAERLRQKIDEQV